MVICHSIRLEQALCFTRLPVAIASWSPWEERASKKRLSQSRLTASSIFSTDKQTTTVTHQWSNIYGPMIISMILDVELNSIINRLASACAAAARPDENWWRQFAAGLHGANDFTCKVFSSRDSTSTSGRLLLLSSEAREVCACAFLAH